MLILNLGCGLNRKRFYEEPFPKGTLHLDREPSLNPDIVWDLNDGLPLGGEVKENSVDEIHAYHVIEHIGKMGETGQWFKFWGDCWRALKPYGTMYVIAPYYLHECAIGDPTHSRLICKQTFLFLNRKAYINARNGIGGSMSQIGIDFDFPSAKIELISNPGDNIPSSIMAELTARKTSDGRLVDLEKEASFV